MSNLNIIAELEFIYKKMLENGEYGKAQEVLLKITEIKTRNESGQNTGPNILLG